MLTQERIQSQLADQFQRQPRTTKLDAVFHAHGRRIDRDPLRLMFAGLAIERKQLLLICGLSMRGRSFDRQPTFLVESSQVSHDPLSRTLLGTVRFDQGPIGVSLSILRSVTRPNEHDRSSY